MDRTGKRREFSLRQSPTHQSKSIGLANGYGVVSFGTKDLDWVVRYLRNQKDHHKKGTIVGRLEKITDEEGDES
jgi:hypothetical protein